MTKSDFAVYKISDDVLLRLFDTKNNLGALVITSVS